ncbi:rhodanese-like domain-containing protein [Neptunicoccus cionae]|uniref:rhodanese-like domain-containing protein n=1 Tax=Neptunicoccus cionae TaxID=2035344 RepID=UPI000C76EF75|nr:rhodanese-like domain-containing protein [Amylibacter cionae]PLS20071.1 sulfurtransferase [Amylibacter cionae]
MTNKVSEVEPQLAWEMLRDHEDTVLVDVRTQAEWSFVGLPDLSELGKQPLLIQWMTLPAMQPNPDFLDGLVNQLDGAAPSRIFFLCRSGARSMAAASLTAEAFAAQGKTVECVNIAEGFEGDLNENRHRGDLNGWKARGLAWRQS